LNQISKISRFEKFPKGLFDLSYFEFSSNLVWKHLNLLI
jgi:hypothetical protein